ncbi:MAG: DNA-3-methyladenine glycosylase I [Spirochaetales bacterium]|nr:DNA-3-methyladenine glycosylase I [Spirochaetales bacterium]
MKDRCSWCSGSPEYIEYHDTEWGVPVYDDKKLFEMLILEGAQAGLSWITILKRRDSYRLAYDSFEPEKIAEWSDEKINELLNNPGIIRNRLKVESARQNAKAYLKTIEDCGAFSSFLWEFVGGTPVLNKYESLSDVPAKTKESEAMSKALQKRGFKFVGPTICYAFMQAVGMVNDHLVTCFRYKEIANLYE